MSHHCWLQLVKRHAQASRRARIRTPTPSVEALEDRTVLTTLIVSPGGVVPGSFRSIQAAVTAANVAGGDTIQVDTGTYTEQVTINKSLTIFGNGAGAIIQAPATLASNLGQTALVEVGNGATVNMSDLTLEGPGPSAGLYVVGGATLNVTGTTIDKMRQSPLNGVQTGRGILVGSTGFAQVGHATITGCIITDYQKSGIVTGGNGTTVTITSTTVTGVGPTPLISQNGIQITGGTTAQVSNNTISGNEFTGTNSGPDPTMNVQSAGILNFSDGGSFTGNTVSGNDEGIFSTNTGTTASTISGNTVEGNRFQGILLAQGIATVSNNTITGNNIGVAVRASSGDTTNAVGTLVSNNITNNGNGGLAFPGGGIRLLAGPGATTMDLVTAHFNRIVGNSVGLDNTTATSADATNNWWGSNAGPGGLGSDTVSGPVSFNPWLVLQVTASPATVQSGGIATVVADLTRDSSGMDTSALGHLPDGIPVSFATNSGTIQPAASITMGGRARATFTAGATSGTAAVAATVDNQTSSATITIEMPQADLVLVKAVNDAAPVVSQTVIFTLIVGNRGPDVATDVIVTDPLPVGLSFVAAAPGQGAYDPTTGTWVVGTLSAGSVASLRVAALVTAVGPVVNSAAARADQFDPTPSDNQAAVSVVGRQSPATVSKRSLLVDTAAAPDAPNQQFVGQVSDGLVSGGMGLGQVAGLASVSTTFGPAGEVVALVTSAGELVVVDAFGAHDLGGGVRAASVAFGPDGFNILLTSASGVLTLFNVFGAYTIGGGVSSASMAFGPDGLNLLVTFLNGALVQYSAAGAVVLGGGVHSAAIAFGPQGEVIDVVADDGTLTRFDAGHAHVLAYGVASAAVSFDPSGQEVLDVLFADRALWQFDAHGVHRLGLVG
jgi:uncharacterized repeat protein (TIGR01451 family)